MRFHGLLTRLAPIFMLFSCFLPIKSEIPEAVDCFVGIVAGNRDHYVIGSKMECQGSCANVTLNVNSAPVSVFLCDPYKVCQEFGFNETCGFVTSEMSMCCCTSSTFCNVRSSLSPGFFNQTFFPAPPRKNVSCFTGVEINPVVAQMSETHESSDSATEFPRVKENIWFSGSYMDCAGECANITLGTIGTLYLCDPIEVCSTLQMSDSCALIERLLHGCCCSHSGCNLDKRTLPTTGMTTSMFSTTTISNSAPRISFIWTIISFSAKILWKMTGFNE